MYFVYILTNHSKTVLYTGVTNNLEKRLYQHKNEEVVFTKRYKCYKLVYFEDTQFVDSAIAREKEIKGWIRAKKENLITSKNPDWKDLSKEWNN